MVFFIEVAFLCTGVSFSLRRVSPKNLSQNCLYFSHTYGSCSTNAIDSTLLHDRTYARTRTTCALLKATDSNAS